MASGTKRRAGIGRGLAAILPETPADAAAGELLELPVTLIKPNPNQPRTHFDPDALSALAASIEASGVVQPLLVRPLADGSYELVAGERRWRAAQQAGLEKVPAVVRDQAEPERLQAALIENMVREDLNPVEEAKACAALVEDLEADQRGAGAPGRPQPPRDLQPDPPARAARRGARDAGKRRAQRRPTAAPSSAPPATTSAAASPATRRRGMVGPRDRGEGSAGRPAKSHGRGGRPRSPPTSGPRSRTRPTRSRRRSATRSTSSPRHRHRRRAPLRRPRRGAPPGTRVAPPGQVIATRAGCYHRRPRAISSVG